MSDQRGLIELADETQKATELYVRYKVDYYKLHVAERLITVVYYTIASVLVLTFGSLFLLFISLAGALYLGNLLDNTGAGFLIMGGAYLVVLIIILLMRKIIIQRPILRVIINEFFGEKKREI